MIYSMTKKANHGSVSKMLCTSNLISPELLAGQACGTSACSSLSLLPSEMESQYSVRKQRHCICTATWGYTGRWGYKGGGAIHEVGTVLARGTIREDRAIHEDKVGLYTRMGAI